MVVNWGQIIDILSNHHSWPICEEWVRLGGTIIVTLTKADQILSGFFVHVRVQFVVYSILPMMHHSQTVEGFIF